MPNSLITVDRKCGFFATLYPLPTSKGVWTRRAQGKEPPECVPIQSAIPTATHMAIKALIDAKICKFVVSTNVDGNQVTNFQLCKLVLGLHRRSGIPKDMMVDLHGNCFRRGFSLFKCRNPFDISIAQIANGSTFAIFR